jgi:hypothetical protein
MNAASLVNNNISVKIFDDRLRHHSDTGEGGKRTAAPPSRERTWDSRSALELHQRTHNGGEDRRLQKAL